MDPGIVRCDMQAGRVPSSEQASGAPPGTLGGPHVRGAQRVRWQPAAPSYGCISAVGVGPYAVLPSSLETGSV